MAIGWVIGFFYGAAIWVVFVAAQSMTGWRRYLLWAGPLLLPLIPIFKLLTDASFLVPFVVGTAIGVAGIGAGDLAFRTRANRSANREVPLSEEAVDQAYMLVIRDVAARQRLTSGRSVRTILVLLLAIALLVGQRQLVSLFAPELAASGTLDGVFATVQWIGMVVIGLALVAYVGGFALLQFRSRWRVLTLTDDEFRGAQQRFLEKASH